MWFHFYFNVQALQVNQVTQRRDERRGSHDWSVQLGPILHLLCVYYSFVV